MSCGARVCQRDPPTLQWPCTTPPAPAADAARVRARGAAAIQGAGWWSRALQERQRWVGRRAAPVRPGAPPFASTLPCPVQVVDAASAARTHSDASHALERLSPAARQALRGGVLLLRVQRVRPGRGEDIRCSATAVAGARVKVSGTSLPRSSRAGGGHSAEVGADRRLEAERARAFPPFGLCGRGAAREQWAWRLGNPAAYSLALDTLLPRNRTTRLAGARVACGAAQEDEQRQGTRTGPQH